jgi:hypothetical protein
MDVSSQFLRHAAEGSDFLFNIVTGDESWSHHFDPERKQRDMEYHHKSSPQKELCGEARDVSKSFRTESIKKYTLTFGITR